MLTQSQSEYLWWPNGRQLRRKATLATLRAKKRLAVELRAARRKSRAAIRRQYFLTNAYADLTTAIRRNEDVCITSIILALVLCYSVSVTGAHLALQFFLSAYQFANAIGMGMGPILLAAGVAFGVFAAWVMMFILNMLSIAIMDGATSRKYRSTRSMLRRSLRYTTRSAQAWAVFGSLLFAPLAVAALLGLSYVRMFAPADLDLLTILPVAIIAAASWIIVSLMRFSLIPYVALFEPTVPLKAVVRRSTQLVARRGHIFTLSLYGSAGIFLAGAYGAAHFVGAIFGITPWIFFGMATLAAALVVHAMLVVLYRKRKLARLH